MLHFNKIDIYQTGKVKIEICSQDVVNQNWANDLPYVRVLELNLCFELQLFRWFHLSISAMLSQNYLLILW